jgi:beta-galactosidase
VASDVVRTSEKPDHLTLELDTEKRSFVADGADIVLGYAKIRDQNGTLIPSAVNKVSFTVSGPAEVVGGPEIKSNPVTAEGGIAPVMIRSGLKPGTITITASAEGLKAATATLSSIPFVEDVTAGAAFFEPLVIKLDLGAPGQHIQPGWTGWTGATEADESKCFAALGGATIMVKKANGSGGVSWVNTGDRTGELNFVAEDGVMASGADGLSLTFKGLRPGRYRLTTWHQDPTPRGQRSHTSLTDIFVDDAESKNRQVASEVMYGSQRLAERPGPMSATFIFTTDAAGEATVRFVAGDSPGDVWLNGFKLEEMAKTSLGSR